MPSLNGERLLLFSYGSGAASAMFSLVFKIGTENALEQLKFIQNVCDTAIDLLDARHLHTPEQYYEVLDAREKLTIAEGLSLPTPNYYFITLFFSCLHSFSVAKWCGSSLIPRSLLFGKNR